MITVKQTCNVWQWEVTEIVPKKNKNQGCEKCLEDTIVIQQTGEDIAKATVELFI